MEAKHGGKSNALGFSKDEGISKDEVKSED